MNTCDTCKNWGPEVAGKMKECISEKKEQGYTWEPEEMADDMWVVEGDEGWGCFTGSKFGCIHHELR